MFKISFSDYLRRIVIAYLKGQLVSDLKDVLGLTMLLMQLKLQLKRF
jgi:hypothetical protein